MTEVELLRAVVRAFKALDFTALRALLTPLLAERNPLTRVRGLAQAYAALDAALARLLTFPATAEGALRDEATRAVREVGRAIAFEVPPIHAIEVAQASAVRFAQYWGAECDRLKGEARGVLMRGLERGAPVRQVAADLARRADVSKARALTIARTEMLHAYNAGAARSAEIAAGFGAVLVKVWRSASDARVRDSHRRVNGERAPMQGRFSNGLLYPHEPGAPAREVVNCRCVVTYRRADDRPAFADQERVKRGKQVQAVGGNVPARTRDDVLRGAQVAGLDGFLASEPIARLNFRARLADRDGEYNGHYNPRTREIAVSLNRPKGSGHGVPFRWGAVESVSVTGATRDAALQRTFVHELGHHLHYVYDARRGAGTAEALISPAFQAARRRDRLVSDRASINWKEYFCETHSAYVYARRELQKRDPDGYNLVEKIRAELGVKQ